MEEETAGRTALIHLACLANPMRTEQLSTEIEQHRQQIDTKMTNTHKTSQVQLNKKFKKSIINTVRILLEKGFDPLIQTYDSTRSALHFACATGNKRLVDRLLKDVRITGEKILNCKDSLGRTVLHYVSQGPKDKRSASIVKLIMKRTQNSERLAEKDNYGCTALLLAVDDDNIYVVKALLRYQTFKVN